MHSDEIFPTDPPSNKNFLRTRVATHKRRRHSFPSLPLARIDSNRMEAEEEAVPGQAEAATASAVTEQPLGARSTRPTAGLETGGIEELEKTSKIIVQQVCTRAAIRPPPFHRNFHIFTLMDLRKGKD